MSLGKLSDVYYTASQARRMLGLTEDAFQGWIKAKKITKIILPNRKQGVFAKSEIKMIAAGIDNAYLLAKSPLRFEKATLETQEGEFKLTELAFGERTRQFHEKRIELLKKNPDMSYYVFDTNFVVASMNIVPMQHEAILQFKDGERGWLMGQYVEQYAAGKPLELIIIDCITTPLAPLNRRRFYAQRLFFGVMEVFAEMAKRGIEIATIYACGGTPDGREILDRAHFTYLGEPRPNRHIYELDVATSDFPLLIPYKEALTRYREEQG
jgi:hypothetical protein